MDRKISRKLKGKALDSCVMPSSKLPMTWRQQQQPRLQVCENNWIRRIVGVKRVEGRRMKDLREEVGTKGC